MTYSASSIEQFPPRAISSTGSYRYPFSLRQPIANSPARRRSSGSCGRSWALRYSWSVVSEDARSIQLGVTSSVGRDRQSSRSSPCGLSSRGARLRRISRSVSGISSGARRSRAGFSLSSASSFCSSSCIESCKIWLESKSLGSTRNPVSSR